MADGAGAQRQTGLQAPQLRGDEEGKTTLQWIKTMTLWKIDMLTIMFFQICLLRVYPTVRCGVLFGKHSWSWVWEAPRVCVVWCRSDQKANMTRGFTPSWQHPHWLATTSGPFGYASPHVRVKMQPEKINTEPHSSRQNTLRVSSRLRRVGRERTPRCCRSFKSKLKTATWFKNTFWG